MAKIQDKLYNRVIEGELLEITEEEKSKLGLGGTLYLHNINISLSDGTNNLGLMAGIVNTSNTPMTISVSGNYAIIDFKSQPINTGYSSMGNFIARDSSMNGYIVYLVPWGGNSNGFSKDEIKFLYGSSTALTKITSANISDNITKL